MVILSFFSFIFSFFIPGSILIRFLKIKENSLISFVFGIPLSFVINYFLIILLTALGIYNSTSILTVFLVLIIIWFKLGIKNTKTPVVNKTNFSYSLLEIIIGIVSILILIFYITRWIKSLGTIFSMWDVVLSWNRWALDWFKSSFPSKTWQYPQLIPVLISIPYQFIGTSTVQFFSKSLITSIPIIAAISIFLTGLNITTVRISCFVAAPVYLYLANRLLFPLSGLADAPLSSLIAILILQAILVMAGYVAKYKEKTFLYFMSITAGIVSITKQGGIPYLFFFTFWLYYFLKNNIHQKSFWKITAVSFLIALSWYLPKEVQIFLGKDESAVKIVLDAVGTTFSHRLENAFNMVYIKTVKIDNSTFFQWLSLLIVFSSFFYSFYQKLITKLVFFIFILLFILWSFGTSYDTRNLANAVPLLTLLIASGFYNAFRGLNSFSFFNNLRIIPQLKNKPLVFLFVFLIIFQTLCTDDTLVKNQLSLTRLIEYADVNQLLYDFENNSGFQGKILTSYQIVGVLPKLSHLYIRQDCEKNHYFYQPALEARYLLLSGFCSPHYKESVFALEASGKMKKLLTTNDFHLFKIN